MKALQALYDEIIASDELKKEFSESIATKEDVAAFLKRHECSATADELIEFIKEKLPASGRKMSEEELSAVAGGKVSPFDVVTTIATVFGCIAISVNSDSPCIWD